MRLPLWILAAATLAACESQPELMNEIDPEPDTRRILLTFDELPPMPEYPEPHGGRLATVSAGDRDIRGEWRMNAGICREIGLVEMYAGPSGLRTALVLRLPEGDAIGTYPVVAADADFPTAPAALIAVQVYDEPDAFGFQAYSGELEITEFGDRLSGRFASTLREIRIDMLTHYAGTFEDIRIETLAADYCAEVGDSTFGLSSEDQPDTTTQSDR